ncbi:hypothetical protein MLD38_021022 [Melastoma candidum]|uniref:Uncharacterized protein n=1 Tax=Melastoma candidum TaxID=119954 RepID=A0ACB9QF23_9MYRT|nr:hypothetical protein MLD38_021022 [Melastoma candidum]
MVEKRILVAPEGIAGEHGIIDQFMSLRHPKSGQSACYLFSHGNLLELHRFKSRFGSWFLGNYVSKDGCLYMATPVDPVFVLLPLFEDARMKKGDEAGKFRQLDEIMFVDGFPAYHSLVSAAEKSMHVVCEVKEIGSTQFFRLDDSKVLSWLSCKAHQLKNTLATLDRNYAARSEKETLADAVAIMGEYLTEEPWIKHLCDNLNLNLTAEIGETAASEKLHAASGIDDSGSVSAFQAKVVNKSVKGGKQAKKAKLETDSRNIREMFTRASSRKSG